jgi:molybdopterin-guanine dinucleotide biosynthesis protein A
MTTAVGTTAQALMTTVTGAIIAGGSASRLNGRPKGLEIVDGVRIIDRVAAALRAHTHGLLIAPGSLDATGWIRDAVIAPDLLPVKASITGIHAAIAAAAGSVIALAWDMPFVPAALVAELSRRIGRSGGRAVGSVSAVVPIVGNRPEPLCAAYATHAAEAIAAAVRAGTIKNADVLAQLPNVVILEESELRRFGDPEVMFFNVNTPADLERAEEIAKSL